ncbi:toprim domain-containing protein [Chitinophaga sp. 212800010-3]|uniref:toprim domain-containing protein n=1 Tax=unclassified Chitinophaga TaxID=2619133 RepID=UPI002DEF3B02|nr:Toprim-like [Chitinophaga sp. 212800010-3]
MTIEQAKALDMVDYLAKLGFQPEKINEPHYWYISPLRPDEKTPSFKINRRMNKWKDWGSGESGNIIDFGIQYHQCSVKELLQKLDVNAPLFKPAPQHSPTYKPDSDITIQQVKPITSIPLIQYVRQRGIPLDTAEKFLKEVHYSLKGKNYYALGFKNDAGGYELRNQYIKASSSPKTSTFIDNKTNELAVFEGFFNFLTHQSMHRDKMPQTNYLVLNSLSFFDNNLSRMTAQNRVYLFLDNDKSGDKFTQKALALDCQKFSDERKLYSSHKDLNEWVLSIGPQQHKSPSHQQQHRSQ